MAVTERKAAARPVEEDVDFDAELVNDTSAQASAATSDRNDDELGEPSLIVDNIHVKYRIFGGKRALPHTEAGRSRLGRLLRRPINHVGPAKEIHALRGVSFIARHGESIGVVGRNGSGKSTMLRAIAGLLPLADGAVYVSGQASLLGVNAALIKDLTGERNILIGGLALGLTKDEIRERMDEIVDFAGIGDFVYQPMQAYSSGMGARLRFAISSAARPDILMIDEALATGDAEFRAKSKARIDEIREHAGTVFLVSHSLKTIQQMCSRVLWIDRGELKMDGPADEVCAAYQEAIAPRPKSAAKSPGKKPPAKKQASK
jgi:teichoic acid transport system ATP-binding protein